MIINSRSAKTHIKAHWKDYLLNLSFVILLMTGHTLSYAADAEDNNDGIGNGEFRLHSANGSVDIALLKNTDIKITANGLLARVIVKQQFHNSSTEWVEGEYVFPLPENSAVDYMAMIIGERRIIGEIKEKKEAKKIYEEAKKSGKKASLVVQQRTNLFTNRVANIAPGETIEIELHYFETLQYDQGQLSLRIPTTITPRYIPGTAFQHYQSNNNEPVPALSVNASSGWARPTDQVPDAHLITPFMTAIKYASPLTLNATINAGMALDTIESVYHPAAIEQTQNTYSINLDSTAKLTKDVVLRWVPATGQAPVAALFNEKINDDNYLLLMVVPPQELQSAAVLPRETVFIIDTSGSMSGQAIVQAKNALRSALTRLKPQDRFNIIEFNSVTNPLWQQAVPADQNNIETASRWISQLVANGGTEMSGALNFALADDAPNAYVRQVIFITDGSVGNENALFDLIEKKRGKTRIFTVGIGSAPNSFFMSKAAEAGRGSFTYIGSQSEISQSMATLFHKLQNPVMTDIQIDFGQLETENSLVEVFPEQAPDLYAGEPIIVAAKISGELPSYVSVSGRKSGDANGDGKHYQQQLDLLQNANANDISKLWARKKLHQLYDDERNLGFSSGSPEDKENIKQSITQLALDHSLMSKYTSFVAVEEKVSRPSDALLAKRIAPNAMPEGNTMSVPVPQGALGLKSLWQIALLALLGLMFLYHQQVFRFLSTRVKQV